MAETEQRLLADILAYLRAHPAAEDTLDGIAEWWSLEPHLTPQPRASIAAAVAELMARGVLEVQHHRDGRVTYRCRRREPGRF